MPSESIGEFKLPEVKYDGAHPASARDPPGVLQRHRAVLCRVDAFSHSLGRQRLSIASRARQGSPTALKSICD